jgi:hypothetical protein
MQGQKRFKQKEEIEGSLIREDIFCERTQGTYAKIACMLFFCESKNKNEFVRFFTERKNIVGIRALPAGAWIGW